jgi:predicted GNAT family acetyltransferase
MDVHITHDEEWQQFTAEVGEEEAELAYAMPSPQVLDFTHTYVPKSERGKGVAYKLIERGLCYAEENGFRVVATCPTVKKFIDNNPQYQKLLHQQ